MDIQYYITFREVARCLNFTHAAERLGYAQSSVTVQIQKLEKLYGKPLFERMGKSMALTPDGIKLLDYANRIVESFHLSKEALAGETAGSLRIGTIETLAAFFLPPYLRAFRSEYAHTNLALFPSNEDEVIKNVKSGALDVGIILDPPYSDAELLTIPIRREPLVVISSPEHPFSNIKELQLSDLQDQSIILTEVGCTYRAALERSLANGQIAVRVVSELGSIEAIKQCVMIGLGAALIPQITVQAELDKGVLAASTLKEGLISPFYSQIVMHKNKFVSAPLKHFISLLTDES